MSSTKKPRVTIGMPVYNGGEYLQEALDAILTQTFADFELIISDNASTDGTASLCRRYAASDSRIRYLRQRENRGAAWNYNLLVEEARGMYFKWAAHDDLIEPDFLRQCVEALDVDPGASLAYAKVVHIDEDGNVIEHYHSGMNLCSHDPVERFRRFFDAPPKCSPVFGLIRTRILRKTGMIGSYIASDRVLLGELSLYGRLLEVPEPLFLRRIHELISTTAHRRPRDLAAWFDPQQGYKFLYPTWKLVFAYRRAIYNAPLTPQEKAACHAIVNRYFFAPRKWPYMLRELVRAGISLPGQAGYAGVQRMIHPFG